MPQPNPHPDCCGSPWTRHLAGCTGPEPIRFRLAVLATRGGRTVGTRRTFTGTMPADPNRGDPLGAVADRVRAVADLAADHYGADVDYCTWTGTNAHHGMTTPDRPRHPFTAYGVRMVTP